MVHCYSAGLYIIGLSIIDKNEKLSESKSKQSPKLSWCVNLLLQNCQNQVWGILNLDNKITNKNYAQLLLFEYFLLLKLLFWRSASLINIMRKIDVLKMVKKSDDQLRDQGRSKLRVYLYALLPSL